MAKSIRSNISILIVAVFFIIALFKLFHLQIIDGNRYELLSRNNFLREAIIPSLEEQFMIGTELEFLIADQWLIYLLRIFQRTIT